MGKPYHSRPASPHLEMLSREAIEKFKKLMKQEYGVDYTDKEAREAAENLVNFFELLIKIDRRNR